MTYTVPGQWQDQITYLRTNILNRYLHVPVRILPFQQAVQGCVDIDKELSWLCGEFIC
jgi:hypothetical protein